MVPKVLTRTPGVLAIAMASAALARPAAALNIESAQVFTDMNAHPSNSVFEDGSSVQWWPVQAESGGWSLTVVRRGSALEPVWQVSLPIPADVVSRPTFKDERNASTERVQWHLRERAAAEVLIGPEGDALVAYVDGFSILGVPVSADGRPGEPKELAPVAEGDYALASSESGDRLALVSKGQLMVFDSGGNTIFSVELGKGLRGMQPIFMPDGHLIVAGNRGQEEAAVFAWYDATGQLVHTTVNELLTLNGETLIPLRSGEQQYLLFPYLQDPAAYGGGVVPPVQAFFALPMSLEEDAGVSLELGSEAARRNGSGNDHYKTKQEYRPGATAILGVVPDGEGGLIYALRGSRKLAVVKTENGVQVGSAFLQVYAGELVAERMDAEGNIVWTTPIPEHKRSSVGVSDARMGHVGIHDGTVTLLSESGDCGGLYRNWCHVAIDATDGTIVADDSYRRFLPQSGLYVPELSWTAPDGTAVYTFRARPRVGAFRKTFDTDSGYMVQVDAAAPGPGLSLANPLAIRGEGPEYEAGREFGRAADAQHLFRRPMVKGSATGFPAALAGGFAASFITGATGPGTASTAISLGFTAGLGGLSARYFEKRPGKWWGSQSSDFQAGYSRGYPRRSLRRATIGGTIAGLLFGIPLAAAATE